MSSLKIPSNANVQILTLEMETDEPNLAKDAEIEKNNDEEDAMTCNICFEAWSNTGTHRISSLKCGHFFGLSCIEKWLNSTGGNDCPTCNEKASKKDIRHHYVATLKAIDTGNAFYPSIFHVTLKKPFQN